MGLREVFDRVAADYSPYELSPIHEALLARTQRLLRKELARGSTVLDVGCGPGTFSVPLALEGYRVTAIDLSPRMIELVEARAKQLRVDITAICADAHDVLPRLKQHGAAIAMQGPLSYAEDPLPMVRKIAERVEDNGLLIFAFARAASLEQILRDPMRAAAPIFEKKAVRAEGELKGETIAVHLHDPPRLIRALNEVVEVIDHFAIGLSPKLPALLDAKLGRAPIFRRLGATTVYVARPRNSGPGPGGG